MWWAKVLLCISFSAIAYQDLKYKSVSLYWFILVGLALGLLHYHFVVFEQFLTNVAFNLVFVTILVLIIYTYIKLRGINQFSKAIGSGDILMFFVLSLSFSTLSFMFCFIFSLFFSLILSLYLNRKDKNQIPLAGYMSIFFGLIFIAYWLGFIRQLYSI